MKLSICRFHEIQILISYTNFENLIQLTNLQSFKILKLPKYGHISDLYLEKNL